jgi:hypothetical protein
MVGCFLFHRRNGLHVSLFIARSCVAFMRSSDRWRDWECGGRSARVSVTHPASCPAIPVVVVVGRARAMVAGLPGEDCPEGSPAAARSVVPVSPAVSPAVQSASRLPKFQLQEQQRRYRREVPARPANGTDQSVSQRSGIRFAARKRQIKNVELRSDSIGTELYAGAWQTASMLWPSGSSTNAP